MLELGQAEVVHSPRPLQLRAGLGVDIPLTLQWDSEIISPLSLYKISYSSEFHIIHLYLLPLLFTVSYSSPKHTFFILEEPAHRFLSISSPANLSHNIIKDIEAWHPSLLAHWPSHLQRFHSNFSYQFSWPSPKTLSILATAPPLEYKMHTSLSDHKVIHSALILYTCSLPSKSLDSTFHLFNYYCLHPSSLSSLYRVHYSSLQPFSYRYTQLTCPTAFTSLPHANPSPGSIHWNTEHG